MPIESCATDSLLNHISELIIYVSLTALPEKLKKKKNATGMVLYFQTKDTQRHI